MIRKWLAIGIILLFVGVTIAPTINFNTVKASPDDDLVEVTTQACGIQGYKDTTVKLTREQYQDLEQYLVEFRARLNQTTTREEAVPIFKDAVVELDKYGLLPRGMSVEQAQNSVISGYQNQYSSQHQKIYYKNFINQIEVNNRLCLVAGNTDDCFFYGLIFAVSFCVSFTIILSIGVTAMTLEEQGFEKLAERLYNFTYKLVDFFGSVRFFPFEIGGMFTFGGKYFQGEEEPALYVPSNGWIYSLGLRGVQTINGSFYGTIAQLSTSFYNREYLGLLGFIGLVVGPHYMNEPKFFLGSAYSLGVRTSHP